LNQAVVANTTRVTQGNRPSVWQNAATDIQLGNYLLGKYVGQALLGLQKYTNKQTKTLAGSIKHLNHSYSNDILTSLFKKYSGVDSCYLKKKRCGKQKKAWWNMSWYKKIGKP
jgi:hypothetical protein